MKDKTTFLMSPMSLMAATFAVLIACLFLLLQKAWAQMPVPPEIDPFAQLAVLITTWKGLSPWAIAAGFISIGVAAANKFVPDLELKRLAVAALSVLYGLAQLVANGKSLVEAAVLALLTYGGAVVLYETVKGLIAYFKGKAS